MTNEQLIVLLGSKLSQLKSIRNQLRDDLKDSHAVEQRSRFGGGTFTVVPLLNDLGQFIDELSTDIATLQAGGKS